MAVQYSTPINIVRYKNSTLLKLTAGTHEFTSYDYNHETRTGTFQPSSITITANLEGGISIGRWEYSTDGLSWEIAVSGKHGMTFSGRTFVLQATSDLYTDVNSTVTIMCVSSEGSYYDTVTIARTIDPIVAFSDVWTDIKLTKDRISLIASDEQIQQFHESYTMVDKLADIEVTADEITSEVHANYATKGYVDTTTGEALTKYSTTEQTKSLIKQSADSITSNVSANYARTEYVDDAKQAAITSANNSTDSKLAAYVTTQAMESAIDQTASSITASVSNTYATKEVYKSTYTGNTLHYLATPLSSGVTRSTSGWTTSPQTMTVINKYLWIYHTYTYGDGSTKDTDPVIYGVFGEDGVGVVEICPLYYVTSSDSKPSAPTAEVTRTDQVLDVWTKAMSPASGSSVHLYTCEQTGYTDGSFSWSEVVEDVLYVDLEERISSAELKITDEAIVSTVTRTMVNGKNLLYDTNIAESDRQYTDEQIIRGGGASCEWVQDSTFADANSNLRYGTKVTFSASTLSDAWTRWLFVTPLVLSAGVTYTFSFYARAADAGVFGWAYILYNNTSSTNNVIDTSWSRYVCTITPKTDMELNKVEFRVKNGVIGSFYTCGYMLEVSDQATDWEDADGTLATSKTVSSMISQSADSIRLQASKLSWDSTYSSLSENGVLTIKGGSGSGAQTTNVGDAYYRQQIVYGTYWDNATPSAPWSWVTDTSGNQATWTTVRPTYNAAYPNLYIWRQTQTIEQYNKSTCTTEEITDETADSIAREQLIYRSATRTATAITANTYWVTNTANEQGNWTTTRPTYDSSYPVLFVATQRQTMWEYASGLHCSCTTPVIDETTTVIDGGHIKTGSIDASLITTGTLDASKITVSNLSANSIKTGTISADMIYGGTLKLGGQNNEYGELYIYDEIGMERGTWDNGGIELRSGVIEAYGGGYRSIRITEGAIKFRAYDDDNKTLSQFDFYMGGEAVYDKYKGIFSRPLLLSLSDEYEGILIGRELSTGYEGIYINENGIYSVSKSTYTSKTHY